jgi:hypothetical protein
MPGRSRRRGIGRRDRREEGVAEIVPTLMVHDQPSILMDHEVVAQG